MSTVGIAGAGSTIATEFCGLLPPEERVVARRIDQLALSYDRYLICTGYLAGKSLSDISAEQADLTWNLNFVRVARLIDDVIARNGAARICVIGSESGFSGSYDAAYAGAKAALHRYVETKRLRTDRQMLVALAPAIIWDSGMTQRRNDLGEVERRGDANRMGRWLTAEEVATEAYHLLYNASPSLSGQVIRMRP